MNSVPVDILLAIGVIPLAAGLGWGASHGLHRVVVSADEALNPARQTLRLHFRPIADAVGLGLVVLVMVTMGSLRVAGRDEGLVVLVFAVAVAVAGVIALLFRGIGTNWFISGFADLLWVAIPCKTELKPSKRWSAVLMG